MLSAVLFKRDEYVTIIMAPLCGAFIWLLMMIEGAYFVYKPIGYRIENAKLALWAVIYVCIFIAYFPTLNVEFNSDAIAYIHLFHSLSLNQFCGLFYSDLSQGAAGINIQELRPMYGLSYAVSYSIWHLNPVGYHIDGTLLHFANAIVVALIVRNLAPGSFSRSYFAGFLFALVPANAANLGSINGSLTEAVPTLLYLLSFLGFVLYRRFENIWYLILSIAAFIICLLSKETAVTLPVLLLSYDVFIRLTTSNSIKARGSLTLRKMCRTNFATHVPYWISLAIYLTTRKIVFSSFLKEDTWTHTWGILRSGGTSNALSYLYPLRGVIRQLWEVQTFNLRNVVLPFSSIFQVLILGVVIAGFLTLRRSLSKSRRTMEMILYFGLVWYAITSLPLLAAALSVGHLYLPSVGPCIAFSFLLFPLTSETRGDISYVRLTSALLLVIGCGVTLWLENVRVARTWNEMLDAPVRLPATLVNMPKDTHVVIWIPGGSSSVSKWTEEYLPYALQEPFSAADLYTKLSVIETPRIYCCPIIMWWEKAKLSLEKLVEGPQDDKVKLCFISWNQSYGSYEEKYREVTRKNLRTCINMSLGAPIEKVTSIRPEIAEDLLDSLVDCGRVK